MIDAVDPLGIDAVMMVMWKNAVGSCILEMVVDDVMMMVVLVNDSGKLVCQNTLTLMVSEMMVDGGWEWLDRLVGVMMSWLVWMKWWPLL